MTGCSELTQSPSGPACEKGFGHSTLCLSGERARHVRGLPSIVTALQCSSEPLVLRPKLRLQPEVSKNWRPSQPTATSNSSVFRFPEMLSFSWSKALVSGGKWTVFPFNWLAVLCPGQSTHDVTAIFKLLHACITAAEAARRSRKLRAKEGVGWRARFCSVKSHVKLSNVSNLENYRRSPGA